MLYSNHTPNERDQVLARLDSLNTIFYPTGSRFFTPNKVYPHTDVDLYTEYTRSIQDSLYQLGFRKDGWYEWETAYSEDPNLIEVWRHPSGVDVQLVQNLQAKHICQAIIKEFNLLGSLQDKYYRAEVWQRAFHALQDIPS